MDEQSAQWLRELSEHGDGRDPAVARLHGLLLRAAITEASRRSGTNGIVGQELEDLAHQAADDATMSVLRRLSDFRGESRFTTWAYKFAINEVSTKVGRHVWRRDGVRFDEEAWARLPDHLGHGPTAQVESSELAAAIRTCVETVLTTHQRRVFVAIALHGTPLDAVVAELDTNRNAIYKTMFDARRKLRSYLVGQGLMPDPDQPR